PLRRRVLLVVDRPPVVQRRQPLDLGRLQGGRDRAAGGEVAPRARPTRSPIELTALCIESRTDVACASGNSAAICPRMTWAPTSTRTVNSSIHHGLRVA